KPRLTAEDWILAGFRSLSKTGPDGLKAEPLARALTTTKGSFYWHFKDVADFHDRMMAFWEDQATHAITRTMDKISDPVERLYALGTLAVSAEDKYGGDNAEAALRAWAQSHSRVAAIVHRIDAQRIAYVADILAKLGLTNPDFARIIYAAYIGFGTLSAKDGADNRDAMSTLMAAILALRDA
ncbi:MAG TPA: TetR/AcrR family transcriptional regulator, partial [Aliiroseovarius sp.]|nr:TetR/AcrR family transcriptional regulator [Aliiroseovarius sp.]